MKTRAQASGKVSVAHATSGSRFTEKTGVPETVVTNQTTKATFKQRRRRHIKDVEKPYECKICHANFALNCYLTAHSKIHGERKEQCPKCAKLFLTKNEVTLHMRTHTQEKPYVCSLCPYASAQKSNLTTHMSVHGNVTYSCTKCTKSFRHKHTLKCHIRCEHNPTGAVISYSCVFCPKKYKDPGALRRHIKDHIGEEVAQECPICSKKFRRLRDHMVMHRDEKPFSCTLCPMKFKRKPELKLHMRVHTGRKPYSCTMCPSTFTQNPHLRAHLRAHTGERALNCPNCPMTFRERGPLKQHIQRHEGTLPLRFECTTCNKKFLSSTHLKTHYVVHTGEKNFKCDICGLKVGLPATLVQHQKIHSETRRNCLFEGCKAVFYREDMQKLHLRTHLKEKPNSCHQCSKEFNCTTSLRNHVAKIHKRGLFSKNTEFLV